MGRRLQPIDLQKAKTPSVLQARILELRGVCTLQDALRGGNVPNVPEEAILKRLTTYVRTYSTCVSMYACTHVHVTFVPTYLRTYVRTYVRRYYVRTYVTYERTYVRTYVTYVRTYTASSRPQGFGDQAVPHLPSATGERRETNEAIFPHALPSNSSDPRPFPLVHSTRLALRLLSPRDVWEGWCLWG